ncbi:ABC transporter ATP-binding protein, partial [Streptomyces sp. NPDC049577]
VRIDAESPDGGPPPPGLPGDPSHEPLPGGAGVRLTVPAAQSDALLRALLTACPAWHVRAVTPEEH